MEDKNMMLILAVILLVIDVLMEMETLEIHIENRGLA